MRYNNRMSKVGFVYKITPHNCEEFYIGSTTDMKQRESQHITDSKIKTSKVYIKIRECGGFVMELLYEYECETEPELRMEEQRCIDIMTPTLNTNRAFTNEEGHIEYKKRWYESNRDVILEQKKIYKKINKDAIREKNQIYYESNRDVKLEQHKIYYEKNRDAISEYQKVYYEKNKDAINAKRREKAKLKKQQQV